MVGHARINIGTAIDCLTRTCGSPGPWRFVPTSNSGLICHLHQHEYRLVFKTLHSRKNLISINTNYNPSIEALKTAIVFFGHSLHDNFRRIRMIFFYRCYEQRLCDVDDLKNRRILVILKIVLIFECAAVITFEFFKCFVNI